MDLSFLQHTYLQNAIAASFCTGVSCAIVGVFVVTMHLSLLGVCIAHAAFAGALFANLLQIDPILGALGFSLAAAGIVGPLADQGELSPDTSVGIIFTFMLGLAFVFMGMMPGARTGALSLFWGNVLTVPRRDLVILAGVMILLIALLVAFFKEIRAVVCHRQVALAVGIPATLVLYGMLFATGVTITVSLPCVGGLLVYGLVLNPAAAAFQLTYSLRRMFILAAVFGVLSCWVGLAASYMWDIMAGAAIIVTTCVIFGLAALFSPKRRTRRWKRAPIAK